MRCRRLARRHSRGRGLAPHARTPCEWHRAGSRPKLRRTVRRAVLARDRGPLLWRLAFSRVRADGSALAAGNNRRGQAAVGDWRDLTAAAAGYLHTVALRRDGRVLAAGDRTTGACDVNEWEDAVALAAGSYHTIGATASGRVLAAGDNSLGQCDVGDWQEIVAVAAGSTHPLGLRADGTVLSAGNNASCQCDVDSWSGIQVPRARA